MVELTWAETDYTQHKIVKSDVFEKVADQSPIIYSMSVDQTQLVFRF